MRSRSHVTLFIFSLLLLGSFTASAQFIEDALRMATPPDAVSARSAAMGNAFTGVADDFSAVYWNPAGLGQMRTSEFALGLSNLSVSNDALFLGTSSSISDHSTHLNSIGMALPFPVARGSLVFAGGYNRLVNFTKSTSFTGYNTSSSIIPTLLDNQDNYDLAWNLNLEDTTKSFPIRNNLRQTGDVMESGNLGEWSFGGAMEVGPNMFAGATINVITGSYVWDRSYIEDDPTGVHRNVVIAGLDPRNVVGFESLRVDENLDQSISGWNAKFGFLYKLKEKARIGIAIQTPSMVTVSETYSKSGRSRFNDGTNYGYSYSLPTLNSEYDISTPWILSLGASVMPIPELTVSADADLTDFTTLAFDTPSSSSLTAMNTDIKRTLRQTSNFRGGVEVQVPGTDLFVRGGYRYQFSPYEADKNRSDFDTKTISAGIGYLFDGMMMVNLTWIHSTYSTFVYTYVPSDNLIANDNIPESAYTVNQDVANTWLMLSVGYRF